MSREIEKSEMRAHKTARDMIGQETSRQQRPFVKREEKQMKNIERTKTSGRQKWGSMLD